MTNDLVPLFLLFIAIIMILFIIRSLRSTSRHLAMQKRTQELLNEQSQASEAFQNALLEQDKRQTAALERIAETLEKR